MSTVKSQTFPRGRSFWMSRKMKVIYIILGVLIILRLLLPYIVLRYVNKTLATMDGYYGHVRDIDISLYRGAYQINDLYINKKDSTTGKQTEFIKARNIDLSVEWGAIFHGAIVGELEFNDAALMFTKEKVELGDVKKDTSDFRRVLKKFMPLRINRFEINNSSLHYKDFTSTPKVDVSLKKVHVLAKNLTNAADSNVLLPSPVTAQAEAYGGTLNLDMKINPLAERATFDVNAEVRNVNLVQLNDFLKAYGNFDVNKGSFGLYCEAAAKEGKFKGYVKPIIKDLDVVGPEDRKDNVFQKIWESIVGAAGEVFRNHPKDQVATKVDLQGDLRDPHTSVLDAVWQVLRNAFIQALMPSVDNQININSVDTNKAEDRRNIFQRIFGKKDKKDKSNNKDK